jgi:predicted lipoprotein with Yx(FWY)xxD motif
MNKARDAPRHVTAGRISGCNGKRSIPELGALAPTCSRTPRASTPSSAHHHWKEDTMRNPRITLAAIAVAAVGIGAVALGAASGSTSYGASAGSMPVTSSATTFQVPAGLEPVRTARATVQGTSEAILVDAKGLPLYTYKPDTPTTSHVTGQLAALWPPLVAPTSAIRGTDGVLSTVATSNGNQVAYKGHFLYTFVEDKPGDVTGQGVQNFFVATPGLIGGVSTTATTTPTMPTNSYGY